MSSLSIELIEEARSFLRGRIRETPVEASPELSERLGAPVWLKLECLQTTGSFKVRGALFRLSRLSLDERQIGIVTCSAGNHGLGAAHAAGELGVPVTVYVPASVDPQRERLMRRLGAEVVRSSYPGYDDTEEWAKAEAKRMGLPFLSAFDDDAVMAGSGGTLAAEVIEQVPEAGTFLLPVGGGGLSAGFSFYCHEQLDAPRIIGCQHELSPALRLSLERGEAVTRLPAVETSACGLEGGIGQRTFGVLKERVAEVVLLSEDEILDAVRWFLGCHRYLIEPSAAVTVAACLSGKLQLETNSDVVLVLSGRNASNETIRQIAGR